jgi:hypothetical protein
MIKPVDTSAASSARLNSTGESALPSADARSKLLKVGVDALCATLPIRKGSEYGTDRRSRHLPPSNVHTGMQQRPPSKIPLASYEEQLLGQRIALELMRVEKMGTKGAVELTKA